MSLLSLLIALAAERYLSATHWQFSWYFKRYLSVANQSIKRFSHPLLTWQSSVFIMLFALLPAVLSWLLLTFVDDGLISFLLSTLLLIVCFGCVNTRDCYKGYLLAAFRGELTTCDLKHQQLQQDKALPNMGFGQLLVWLNYRYFIAIMLFFVVFGAPGVIFYRLLTSLSEGQSICDSDSDSDSDSSETFDESLNDKVTEKVTLWLQYIDAIPVRLVAFGYMFVGHFSKALPAWLDNLANLTKPPSEILIEVAEKSEDFMVDETDCTAEPCLLVRLAKRTLLLCLAVISLLILTGVIS